MQGRGWALLARWMVDVFRYKTMLHPPASMRLYMVIGTTGL